jgi:hypothetical protein
MTMTPADKERLLANFNGNPPAHASLLEKLEIDTGLRLLPDYIQFLQEADGGEGFIGDAYVILWPVGELVEMNDTYPVAECAPGLFLFGSDGGGEAFAFDARFEPNQIVSVPFIGMELKLAQPLGSNFKAFLEALFES